MRFSMSGFKTPTAMSPPPKKVKSPPPKKVKSKPQVHRTPSVLYPYDPTLSLMQKFENLEPKDAEIIVAPKPSDNISPPLPIVEPEKPFNHDEKSADPASSVEYPPLPAVQEKTLFSRDGMSTDRASSATYPPISSARETKLPGRHRPNLNGARAGTFSPMSAGRPDAFIDRDRPHTAPLPNEQESGSVDYFGNGTPVMNTQLSSHGFMSGALGNDLPITVPRLIPTSCPDLEVYKRHQSNGRLMVCEAREQHCSTDVKSFLGERTGLRGIEELKKELLGIIEALSESGEERARADLKVVTGNMLERVVAWDLNKAEVLEQSDVPLLSTVPTAEYMNRVDAIYILRMFRSGMRKIPRHDIQFKVGTLPDEDLMALLHFTLLISRPVLVWELDLDEV